MKHCFIFLCLPLLLATSAWGANDLMQFVRRTGSPEITLSLFPERTPEPGESIRVVAQLSRNGKPLTEDDLKTVHTQKFHLLVIDPTLTDYQHIHPEAAPTPGSYVFTFTPKLKGGYRAWADVTPVDTDQQQFVYADLGKPAAPAIDLRLYDSVQTEGYRFTLSFDDTPKAEESTMIGLRVADASGQPVETLEPLMGAFGHLVGFYDDYKTVVHTHPVGKEPRSDAERGGPTLMFHFQPEKPGFMRLFVQVKIGGKDIYAPFGVRIEKASD